ncbi:MAG: hypothetical protein V7L11_12500 [Nostoc sp.]|uniref:hypothetical protein n=1 Tax=Nostoc sp. TaxID=1180 RepID=UPI002FFD46C9
MSISTSKRSLDYIFSQDARSLDIILKMLLCSYFILQTALVAKKVEFPLLFCINHHIFFSKYYVYSRIVSLSSRKTRFLKCLGKSDIFATFDDKFLT